MAVIGEAVYKISYDPNTGELRKALNGTEKTIESSGDNSGAKWATAWNVAAGSLIAKGVSKIASTITSQFDNAISRVDTLKNSQKVFQAMGYSGEDVSDSMSTLTSYLDGLPTSMTTAIKSVQSLSASFGGIEKGTQAFIDMNNAGLAFGASAANIDNAIIQLGQLPLDGPLDGQTWRSLQNSGFTPALTKMAELSGMTTAELKEQFGKGELTVQDFLNMLHKLNEEGAGDMGALKDLARDNTSGIGTAFENLQNRIGKAIAEIITAIGPENIANTINTLSSSLVGIGTAIGNIIKFIQENQWVIAGLAGALAPIMALGIFGKILALTTALSPLKLAIMGVSVAIGIIAAGATWVIENWSGLTQFFGEVFQGIGDIVGNAWNGLLDGAQAAWNGITGIFGNLASFFGSIFSKAWEAVKKVFSTGGRIFDGIKDGIVNAFKAVVNAIIRGINTVVAIPFNAINGVLSGIRGINILGVSPFGWLPSIRVPQIPYLATGGIVPDTNGGRLIVAGDGGEDEWVVPESKMASLIDQLNARGAGGNITINVSGTFATSTSEQRKVAEVIAQRLQEVQKSRLNAGGIL